MSQMCEIHFLLLSAHHEAAVQTIWLLYFILCIYCLFILQSFTQQFVKFLEEESTPAIKVRLPVEEMTKDRPKPPAFNPFSAPVPSQSPFIPSSPPAKKSLGTVGSSQLMVNPVSVAPPSVPQSTMITPVPPSGGGSGRNSPAAKGSLRDILQWTSEWY